MTRNTANRYQHAREIFQAGLEAVAPGSAIKEFCRLTDEILVVDGHSYNLKQFDKIFVLGAGKAGASMAKAIEEILGKRISAGTITVKYDHLEKLNRIKIQEAGHPLPDRNGLNGAKDILQLAAAADEKTLVICLISGGGSALMPLPTAGITLEDKQETTQILLTCGATIHEINTIRKHLSKIKGGGLAQAVYPATLITLILSDVVGDDLDIIASGPGVPDPGTFSDCRAILTKYSIEDQIPAAVLSLIESGLAGTVPETPKPGQPFFKKTQTVIIGNNFKALLKAREKAATLGYNTLLLSSMIEGETRDVAAVHTAIIKEIKHHGYPLKLPACLISGGETTVQIKGSGKGGRNQEFVLAATLKLEGMKNFAIFSAGTDGTDGPTDAAGAFADTTTLDRARTANLNPETYLDNNDSYHFFEKVGGLVKTGPTNTNVMDIRIILISS